MFIPDSDDANRHSGKVITSQGLTTASKEGTNDDELDWREWKQQIPHLPTGLFTTEKKKSRAVL